MGRQRPPRSPLARNRWCEKQGGQKCIRRTECAAQVVDGVGAKMEKLKAFRPFHILYDPFIHLRYLAGYATPRDNVL